MYSVTGSMRYEDRISGGERSEEFGFIKVFGSGLPFLLAIIRRPIS